MAKESAIIVRQECIELVDRSIRRSAHIAGHIFSVRRERVSFMGKPVKDSPMWVTQWESDSTNQHGPLLLLAFSHAKKETQPWPTMSPLWLRFFSSYQFDSFFSLLNFSTQTTMLAIYGGVCVYIHTQAIQAVSSLDRFPFSSSSSVGILLNWPKRDSLTLDRERVVR